MDSVVDFPFYDLQLTLLFPNHLFLILQFFFDHLNVAVGEEICNLLQRHIEHPQIADRIEHLKLADTIVTVTAFFLDKLRDDNPNPLIMTKRPGADMEHFCHISNAK